MGPLGFERGPLGDNQSHQSIHRHFCFFSAASLPFFVGVVSINASLAGVEICESKSSKLSFLRTVLARRDLDGEKPDSNRKRCFRTWSSKSFREARGNQVPSMRQHQSLERFKTIHSKRRRETALFVSRLRISVFKTVNFFLKILFFFFVTILSSLFLNQPNLQIHVKIDVLS